MIPLISNRELTLLRKLNQKKYRQQEHLFFVEGERAVEQVIQNGRLEIEKLVFDEDTRLWEYDRWKQYSDGIPSVQVDRGTFSIISDTENPQGILAVCKMPAESGVEEFADSEGVIIAIDRIQDPGNLGTIIRTAVWFGARGILVGQGSVDLFHPKVVRSTAGATGALLYRYSDLVEDLGRLEEMGWGVAILASDPEAIPLNSMEPGARQVLVVGNEANGVAGQLFEEGRQIVEISQADENADKLVESLNASIALSIALYALTNHQ